MSQPDAALSAAPRISRFSRELSVHVAALAGLLLLGVCLSWRMWPDPIIDFGHELYIPWRLNAGDVPYREMLLVTGPASQLYHAGLFALFGSSYSVLIASNLFWLCVLTGLIYAWLARLGKRWVAFVGAVFFVGVFAFGQYTVIGNYNYMSPYRHEVVHGLIAGMLCLWGLERGRTNKWWTLGAGACCGAAMAMKTEVSVPILGAAMWWFGTGFLSERKKEWGIRGGLFCLGAGMCLTVCIGMLMRWLGPADAVGGVFAAWRYSLRPELTGGAGFYASVGGWDHLSENVGSILIALAVLGMVLGGLVRLDRAVSGVARGRGKMVTGVIAGIVAFIAGGILELWNQVIPTLPTILIVSLGWCGWGLWRELQANRHSHARLRSGGARGGEMSGGGFQPSPEFESWRVWGMWVTFALLMTLKMFFLLRVSHYGFVLALPATLLGIQLLLEVVPRRLLAEEGGRGGLWRGVTICLLAGGIVGHLAASASIWKEKRVSVGKGGDLFWGESLVDRRIVVVQRSVDYLLETMGPQETLAVIPDGTMLNYQIRRRNPTPHLLTGPWDMRAAGGDRVVTRDFQKNPPDWIVVTTDDPGVHGMGGFGSAGYGKELAEWIRGNYQNAATIHEPSQTVSGGYGMSILRRKSVKAP